MVLVVDENVFNVVAITTMLQKYQIETESTTDGKEALEMVQKLYREKNRMYNLILMEFEMPVVDGVETIASIKNFLN